MADDTLKKWWSNTAWSQMEGREKPPYEIIQAFAAGQDSILDKFAPMGRDFDPVKERDAAYDLGRADEKKEGLSLEKQYADTLGKLARRCDIICPWILAEGTEDVPHKVYDAANEIMAFVDQVRP